MGFLFAMQVDDLQAVIFDRFQTSVYNSYGRPSHVY